MKRPGHLIGSLVLLFASVAAAGAQALSTTLGGSQTFDAYGLQTDFHWHGVSGWTGLGYSEGARVGGFAQVPLHRGFKVGAGDQMLSAYLDVDEFDTHLFSVRGVSISKKSSTEGLEFFVGSLSQESDFPYLHMSSTSGQGLMFTPIVAALYRRNLTDTIQLHSFMMRGAKLTSIESIGWKPSKTWRFDGAAGLGAGVPYVAVRGELHLRPLETGVSYTAAGKDFHRDEQPNYSAEPFGLNARLAWSPSRAVRFSAEHQKERSFVVSMPTVESTFNSASLFASIKGFQFSPSFGTTTADNLKGQTLTEMVSVSRQVLPRLRSFSSFIHMASPSYEQKTVVATNEYKVNSRLALRQNYNWINGQNSFSGGVQWMSNRVSFSVDQQMYFSAIAPAFGGKAMFQAWTFSVRLRGPRGTNANVDTFVDPTGRMQWGGYISGLHYDAVAPAQNTSPAISRYVVHGSVVDEAGKGVWGIAVTLGAETVISDENGEFFLHVKSARPLPLHVDPNSSLQSRRWQLKTAPDTVRGLLDNAEAEPVQVVIRMVSLVATKSPTQEVPQQ